MYTGLTGALKIEDEKGQQTTIAYISGWSLNDQSEIIEKRKIGKTYKEAYAGTQSWSASADGVVVFEKNYGQQELFRAKHEGKKIKLLFYLHDSSKDPTVEDAWLEGYGLIESVSIDLSAEGSASISISIRGTEELSLHAIGRDIKTNSEVCAENVFMKIEVDEKGYLVASVDEENASRISQREDDMGSITGIEVLLGKKIIRGGN
jgi:hypothetical protein